LTESLQIKIRLTKDNRPHLDKVIRHVFLLNPKFIFGTNSVYLKTKGLLTDVDQKMDLERMNLFQLIQENRHLIQSFSNMIQEHQE
jgi:hypothetical protein